MRRICFSLLCLLLTTVSAIAQHEHINVAILGDSNTSIGGDSCNKPQGWTMYFKEVFAPASCISYARSGATWTNTVSTKYNIKEVTELLSDDNVIYNQVNRLEEEFKRGRQVLPQLIIIAAGTNDAWFGKARPQRFSKTVQEVFCAPYPISGMNVSAVTSLAQSVRYNCERLMQLFPEAQIVLLTPMQSIHIAPATLKQTADIIEAAGHRMGLSVIRQDEESCVYSLREKVRTTFTRDGTHTIPAGARRNGISLAHRIASILEY